MTISGAHLYGFPSHDSDYDLRGAHVLPASEVLSLRQADETIERMHETETAPGDSIDLVTHDVKKFMRLMLKRNGYILEQLYSPLVVVTSPEHDELKAIGQRCITRHHVHHYLGFAHNQWKLFRRQNPRRVKPLLYVYRVLLTGIHLMRTGRIEANLRITNESFCLSYVDELIERKFEGAEQSLLDDVDVTFHEAEYLRLVAMLRREAEATDLPDEASGKDELSDLLVQLRGI